MSRASRSTSEPRHTISGDPGSDQSNSESHYTISGGTEADRSNSESRYTISCGTEADWSNDESRRTNISGGTREDHSNEDSRCRTISGGTEMDDSDRLPFSIAVEITEDTPWQYTAYDSGESTRGITNPKSHSKPGSSSNQVAATNLNATVRAPIMVIPAKMKLGTVAHSHVPHSIFQGWRTSRLKKSGLAYSEPSSPKVSCWGNVLSETEKEKLRRRREERKELKKKNEVPSCCSRLSGILTCAGDRAVERRGDYHFQLAEIHAQHAEEVHRSSNEDIISEVTGVSSSSVEAEVEAGGVAVLKRISSGRKDESWASDLVEEKEEGTTN